MTKIFDATSLETVLEEDFLWGECVSILLGASRSESNARLRERYGDKAASYIDLRRDIVSGSDPNVQVYVNGKKSWEVALGDAYVLDLYVLRRYIVMEYLLPEEITIANKILLEWLRLATAQHIEKVYQEQVALANEVLAELLEESPENKEFFENKYCLGSIQYRSPDQ